MSSGEPPRPPPHGDYKGKGIAHTKKRKYLLRVSPEHLSETSTAPTTAMAPTQSTAVGPTQSAVMGPTQSVVVAPTQSTFVGPTQSIAVGPTQSIAATILATHTPASSSGCAPTPTSAVNKDAPSTSAGNLHTPAQQPDNDVADDIDLHNRPFIEPYGRG